MPLLWAYLLRLFVQLAYGQSLARVLQVFKLSSNQLNIYGSIAQAHAPDAGKMVVMPTIITSNYEYLQEENVAGEVERDMDESWTRGQECGDVHAPSVDGTGVATTIIKYTELQVVAGRARESNVLECDDQDHRLEINHVRCE